MSWVRIRPVTKKLHRAEVLRTIHVKAFSCDEPDERRAPAHICIASPAGPQSRTVLDEGLTLKEPQIALCKLPPRPHFGGHMVVGKPDAQPGDQFQNVSLVEYKYDVINDPRIRVNIKVLNCKAGEWSNTVFRFQNEELYFNTSWCPILCAMFEEYIGKVPMPRFQSPKETYNTIGGNGSPSKSCVLPPYPVGGGYYVDNQPSAKPGDVYNHLVTVRVYEPLRDGEVYRIKTLVCNNGAWFTKILNLENDTLVFTQHDWCPLICKKFFTDDIASPEVNETTIKAVAEVESTRSCKLPPYPQHGNYTVMNRPNATPGEALDAAYLKYSCHLNKNIVGSKSIFCVDGVWSDEIPKCISCGYAPSSSLKPYFSEEAALRRRLPWHASIYTKDYAPYEQICSGSIIATNVIVTAAHCFWDEEEGLQPASLYAVAVGKVHRSWDDPRDGAAQKTDVNEIRVSKNFRGSLTAFKDDIALLVLRTRLLYDHHVSPVCLDFDVGFDERQLMRGNYGEIASWDPTGAGAKDNESSTLRIDRLPYVDKEECVASASSDLLEYITSDKICAGDEGIAKMRMIKEGFVDIAIVEEFSPYQQRLAIAN
ncbi:Coagulation factor X [Eumeta japonica]|uniref:Coagulation factor X n=1 Tax=Eumeta variegata TaxID=151549 RepID=A0A4C1W5J4_EUMVA|nr:Coagulation factor X [Eumeta japonica]